MRDKFARPLHSLEIPALVFPFIFNGFLIGTVKAKIHLQQKL